MYKKSYRTNKRKLDIYNHKNIPRHHPFRYLLLHLTDFEGAVGDGVGDCSYQAIPGNISYDQGENDTFLNTYVLAPKTMNTTQSRITITIYQN